MAEKTLNFISTQSADKFKADNNISKLQVIKNPHTDKLFFTSPDDSKISGKISKQLDTSRAFFISQVSDEETGEVFNLLHNDNSSDANVQFEL